MTQTDDRLNRVEAQLSQLAEARTERLEAVVKKLDRNYEEQKSSLAEYRITTNATLERIDRILDYLMKGSDNSEKS